jgi:hypothetical protein
MNLRSITRAEGATTDILVVALSRRNLEGLLEQLDADKLGDPAQIMRRTKAGMLIVVAEEDSEHYNSEHREPAALGVAGASGPGDTYGEDIS